MRIGLILGILNDYYCNNIVKYVANEITSRSARLVVIECCNMGLNASENITGELLYKLVESHNIDGLIVVTSTLTCQCTEKIFDTIIKSTGKPAVSIGVSQDGIPSVIVNYQSGFDSIISHFISHNRKDLAFISGPLSDNISFTKYDAFFEAAKKYGIEIPPHLIIEGTNGYMSGYNCAKPLLPFIKNGSVNAVVCSSDELAFSAIKYLKENNIRVPEDVFVSGYNNLDFASYINPSLTTVDLKFNQVFNKAIAVLFEHIFGHKNGLLYSFEPELMPGKSCGCDKEIDHKNDIFYPWTRFNGIRGRFFRLSQEEIMKKLSEYLYDNNISQCYVIQNLCPVKIKDNQMEELKGTLYYGYSKGKSISHSKPFNLSEILPKHILADINEAMVIKPLFMNQMQYGYLFISLSHSMAAFIDDLVLELSQYFTYLYVMSEQRRMLKEANDTHESLMISNKRLNELTVKDNLEKLVNLRHLAANMLENRKGTDGEYVLIIVEVDNFSEINNRYGFSEGELVISYVSNILSNSIRDEDFLSHLCCERYVLLVKNIISNPVVIIGNRFIKALNELNTSLKKPYSISFSWGYASANVDHDFEKAYNEAEQNLLENKQNGLPRN